MIRSETFISEEFCSGGSTQKIPPSEPLYRCFCLGRRVQFRRNSPEIDQNPQIQGRASSDVMVAYHGFEGQLCNYTLRAYAT